MKLHWYSFAYMGERKLAEKDERRAYPETCHASTYTGYKDKKITSLRIVESKEFAGMRHDAVLINCSYLGHMTKEEFETVK